MQNERDIYTLCAHRGMAELEADVVALLCVPATVGCGEPASAQSCPVRLTSALTSLPMPAR